MFKKYRIIEINNNFIPQVRVNLFFWKGIEEYSLDTWNSLEYQIEYCYHATIESAKDTIEKYKKINNKTHHSITYHKV